MCSFVCGWERSMGFPCSLLICSIRPLFCSISHLQRGSQGFQILSFSASESRFSYFLVPGRALHGARVQFLSSVKSITNHSSIFHIAKVGWHLNSVLTSFQRSVLWGLFMLFYFFTIIFCVRFGETAEINEYWAFYLLSIIISSIFFSLICKFCFLLF